MGRLTSYPSCQQQTTVAGTGLRRLACEHQDNTTESVEEAELIAAEIARLIEGAQPVSVHAAAGRGPSVFSVAHHPPGIATLPG